MAGHMLIPEDKFLSVPEVLSRLKREFKHVLVDKERAAREIQRYIEHLELRKEKGTLIDYPFDAEIRREKNAAKRSYYVRLSDCKRPGDAYLATVISPNRPIVFGYTSAKHEHAAAGLLERCARVLGYEIEE